MPKELECKLVNGLMLYYRPNSVDETVLKNSTKYFRDLPFRLKKDDVVLDVGAHIGAFTLLASLIVTQGKIYSLEPCDSNFKIMQKNILVNKASNIVPSKVALSSEVGTIDLHLSNDSWGHSTVSRVGTKHEIVKCVTLKSYFDGNNIDKVDFLKMNCEGAEFSILLNTPKEYLERIDRLLVLYHLDLARGYRPAELIVLLKESGFKVIHRRTEHLRGWLLAHRFPLPQQEAKEFLTKKICWESPFYKVWAYRSLAKKLIKGE